MTGGNTIGTGVGSRNVVLGDLACRYSNFADFISLYFREPHVAVRTGSNAVVRPGVSGRDIILGYITGLRGDFADFIYKRFSKP